jgi:hypothetical protein
VNAVFASGFNSIQLMNPKAPGNFYFNPAGFTNQQNDPATPCNQQVPNELPSDNCAVANPGLRTYGLPRNFFRGPGRTNLDLALAKTTPITERISAEFRVEAFNLFNHTEFTNPDININSGTFGQITSTIQDSERIVQLALRFTF